MGVGRWIGDGMTVGWHSFTPNEHESRSPRVVRDVKPDVGTVTERPRRRKLIEPRRP